MIQVKDLSVGQVSGMIAAAVFVVQFIIPVVLPVIMLGLLRLRSRNVTVTAVSWSVLGRYLHSSFWPILLGTDSAATLSISKSVMAISFFRTFLVTLLGVAAIVTPLGLYESIAPASDAEHLSFHYLADKSLIGLGTPQRSDTKFSRWCGSMYPVGCPNSYNNITIKDNGTSADVLAEGGYNMTVPPEVIDVFQSGIADLGASVSSIFDIQYRSYMKAVIDTREGSLNVNNDTAYTIGAYRPLSSLILADDVVAIEGLIVDMKNGGIGLRNHSGPPLQSYGSIWSEDLLFVEPETVCVDTNLTLDFIIPATAETNIGTGEVTNLVLTDRGGFVNFNTTYPRWGREDSQNNPALRERAYKAAWNTNAYTMAFMNVTNISNDTTGRKAFEYLNSEMGKQFPLHWKDGSTAASVTILPGVLRSRSSWGDYLEGTEGMSNYSESTNTTYDFPSKPSLYPNPFNINRTMFYRAATLCDGTGGRDLANISNFAAVCGTLYGAPRRTDNISSLLFDPGSAWTLPMYSCISTTKASIKTVSFRFNGTDDLSGLKVTNLQSKTYADEASKPLWGVEKTDKYIRDVDLLWGLVSGEGAKKLKVDTLRKESLYIPGYTGLTTISADNLAGTSFHRAALDAMYDIPSAGSRQIDYTGATNLAMYRLWQDLSKDPSKAGKILDLVWTDVAANMVVGTRGLASASEGSSLQKRDGEQSSPDNRNRMPLVTNYVRRVQYRHVYGIPAFIVLLLISVVLLLTALFVVLGRASPSHMRLFLEHTSAGRLLTGYTPVGQDYAGYQGYQQGAYKKDEGMSTKDWVNGAGQQKFTLSEGGWSKDVMLVAGGGMAVQQQTGDGVPGTVSVG